MENVAFRCVCVCVLQIQKAQLSYEPIFQMKVTFTKPIKTIDLGHRFDTEMLLKNLV